MEKDMECDAAKFKLEEAEYFLGKLKEHYNDEKLLTFYFNAMFYGSRSVLDYVWSTFLISYVDPGVSSQEWFHDKEYRKKTREEHPEHKFIQRFQKFHSDKIDELKDDPMMYHLLKKRDVITHHHYAGTMGGLSTTAGGSGEVYQDRYLETMYAEDYLDKNPHLKIYFGKEVSDEKRKELEDKLRREDMRPILQYYIKKLRGFIKEFEELNLDSLR